MIVRINLIKACVALVITAVPIGCGHAESDSAVPETGYFRAAQPNNFGANAIPDKDLFTPLSETLRLDHNFSHWFQYNIPTVALSSAEEWFLQIAFPSIDAATVYVQYGEDILQKGRIGDDVPHNDWPVSTRLPTIPITQNGSIATAVYLDFKATGQPAVLPVKLLNRDHFDKQRETDYLWYGLFFGSAFALILYNLLLFASTRISAYLAYFFYLLPFTVLQGAITGIGQQFFWPAATNFTTYFALVLISITNATMALFVNRFLELRSRRPVAYRWLVVVAGISLALPIGFLFFEYIVIQNIQHLFSVFSMLVITIIAIREFIAKSKPAMYLLISYSVLFVGIIVSLLLFDGIIGSNFISNHLMEMAIIFEAVILSYGMSDRISEIKDTAQALERQSRLDQASYTRKLISAHESEKQHFGSILHDDIGHRVLNMQFQIGSLIDNEPNASTSIKNQLHSVKQSTVDVLEELRHLSASSYPYLLKELGLAKALESLLQKALDKIDIAYSCNIDVGQLDQFVEQQLYRIVQELISNTIKHASATEVLLNITQQGDLITLLYKDDGIGMRPESLENTNGFGITSITERCKLIGGSISFDVGLHREHHAHHGMCCSISGIKANG